MLSNIYDILWGDRLQNLYFSGPSIYNYGFWANKNRCDICAELTSVPAIHWEENFAQCNLTLDNHFRAFETGVNMVLYLTFGITFISLSLCHCMIIRPLTRVIRPVVSSEE